MKRLPSILAIGAFFALAGPVMADETSVARAADSNLPWNRAFTIRDETREDDRSFIPLRSNSLAIPASRKWGVTVNLDLKDQTFENMDRMSAGAYFDLSPRVRLGGSLSFSAPGDLRVSTPRDRVLSITPIENEPAVRIESSIKF